MATKSTRTGWATTHVARSIEKLEVTTNGDGREALTLTKPHDWIDRDGELRYGENRFSFIGTRSELNDLIAQIQAAMDVEPRYSPHSPSRQSRRPSINRH